MTGKSMAVVGSPFAHYSTSMFLPVCYNILEMHDSSTELLARLSCYISAKLLSSICPVVRLSVCPTPLDFSVGCYLFEVFNSGLLLATASG